MRYSVAGDLCKRWDRSSHSWKAAALGKRCRCSPNATSSLGAKLAPAPGKPAKSLQSANWAQQSAISCSSRSIAEHSALSCGSDPLGCAQAPTFLKRRQVVLLICPVQTNECGKFGMYCLHPSSSVTVGPEDMHSRTQLKQYGEPVRAAFPEYSLRVAAHPTARSRVSERRMLLHEYSLTKECMYFTNNLILQEECW